MQYVATIHFDSPVPPLDDADDFISGVRDGEYEITDFHLEELGDTTTPTNDQTTSSDTQEM